MEISVNYKRAIVLTDVLEPVVIRTPQGEFGICERDGGIEVTHQGKRVWHWDSNAVPLGESDASQGT